MTHTLKDVEALLDHRSSSFSNLQNALETAVATCVETLRAEPDNFDAKIYLGRLHLEEAQFSRSAEHFEALAKERPSDWRPHYYLGLAKQRLGLYVESSKALIAALTNRSGGDQIEVDSITVEVMSELGRTYLAAGAEAEAKRYYQVVLDFMKAVVSADPLRPGGQNSFDYKAPAEHVYRILYIPVEIKARELPAKLIIAAEATALGFVVVIGQTWSLLAGDFADLPPGVVLFKTMNSIDAHNAQLARAAGHLTCTLDEEAFGRSTEEAVYRQNTDKSALACMDLLMVQGVAHRQVLERLHLDAGPRISVTGTPRAQLLSAIAQGRVAHEQKEGGETAGAGSYVLVCTMFGNINPAGRGFANTVKTTLELAGSQGTSKSELADRSTFDDCVELELGLFGQTKALVEALANRFPDTRFIVRPHPAEDGGLWESMLAAKKGVTVCGDGPLSDWLADARAMVYLPGCATGIEAKLAGVPAICFQGAPPAKALGVGLSECINRQASQIDDVGDWLAEVEGASETLVSSADDIDVMDAHFYAQSDRSAGAVIAAAIHGLQTRYPKTDPIPLDQILNLETSRESHFVPRPFHRQKFPVTQPQEITELLSAYIEPSPEGREFQAQTITDNVFLIQKLPGKA